MLDFLATYWWIFGISWILSFLSFIFFGVMTEGLDKTYKNSAASLIAAIIAIASLISTVASFVAGFVGLICAIIQWAK